MGNISEFPEIKHVFVFWRKNKKIIKKWHLFPFQKLASECLGEGLSGILLPFKCDLTNEEEIVSMFGAIKQQHGGVDVCINNAGLAHPESLLSGKTSGWRNMLDVSASNGVTWSSPERHKRSSQGQLTHPPLFAGPSHRSTFWRWAFAHVKLISRWKRGMLTTLRS